MNTKIVITLFLISLIFSRINTNTNNKINLNLKLPDKLLKNHKNFNTLIQADFTDSSNSSKFSRQKAFNDDPKTKWSDIPDHVIISYLDQHPDVLKKMVEENNLQYKQQLYTNPLLSLESNTQEKIKRARQQEQLQNDIDDIKHFENQLKNFQRNKAGQNNDQQMQYWSKKVVTCLQNNKNNPRDCLQLQIDMSLFNSNMMLTTSSFLFLGVVAYSNQKKCEYSIFTLSIALMFSLGAQGLNFNLQEQQSNLKSESQTVIFTGMMYYAVASQLAQLFVYLSFAMWILASMTMALEQQNLTKRQSDEKDEVPYKDNKYQIQQTEALVTIDIIVFVACLIFVSVINNIDEINYEGIRALRRINYNNIEKTRYVHNLKLDTKRAIPLDKQHENLKIE